MTEFEREERAFREALTRQASTAPDPPAVDGPVRRRRTLMIVAAAAVLVAATVAAPLLLGGDGSDVDAPADRTSRVEDPEWRWIGVRSLEVQAPADWGFAHELARPDCVDLDEPDDPWAAGVPTSPYVTVTPLQRMTPAIGCTPPRPGNPDPAFGDLPFPLWQPHVRLDLARPELGLSDGLDGRWTHRGWQLARRTFGDVQVSVLTAPDGPAIAERVFASARTVETNAAGCATASPFSAGFPLPDGSPVPPATDVHAVAVCDYSRAEGFEGLQGSWRMDRAQARDLTAAILAAPRGGGPDRPATCLPDMHGDPAVVLRFLDEDDALLADAYAYTQWCFGNGIVDSSGPRELTEESCAPIFSRPEVSWWGGQEPVARRCHSDGW